MECKKETNYRNISRLVWNSIFLNTRNWLVGLVNQKCTMLPLLHLCMITSNSKVRDDPQTKLILTFSLALNCFEDAHMHLPQFWRNSTYVPLIVGNLKSSTCSMMFLLMIPYWVFGRTQIFSGRKDNHDPRRFPMQQKLGLWYFLPERLEWETLQKALPWLGLIKSQPAYIMQFHS